MRTAQLMVLAAVSALSATAATAQDREPNWLKRPTPEILREVFPTEALRKGRNGKAIISCIVTVQGALRDCAIVSEEPAGLGFGSAALALSPQLLMKPALKGGVPIEGTVRIPINWDLAGMGPQMAPTQGSKVYTNLPWRAAPTFEQVRAAYPAKAKAAKISGTAILDCKIEKGGGLSQCRTIREVPTGYGFIAAAKSLAPLFVTPVTTAGGGTAVGSRAHLSITFAASALDASTPVIGKPKWMAVPRINDIEAVMPEAAKKAKVYKARVVMSCTVAAEGGVEACSVMSEDPASLGYGAAAVSLSRYFRLAVWTDEGLPTVGGSVTIPLRFDLESAVATAKP